MGFPIIGASAAFNTLTTTTGSIGAPVTPPLNITGVHLGSGLFLTDRGYRDLPAWLFSLSGVQNPAKVLAVRPSAVYSAPLATGGISPAEMSAMVGVGGRKIVVNFAGASAGSGPCTASYTLSFKESKQAVAIGVISHSNGKADVACAAVGSLRHATAELEEPLGTRVIVDASTKGAVSAIPASSERR
jgi:hypothetical protein